MTSISLCQICSLAFGSRSLAQLHVTVVHPSVSNAALFDTIRSKTTKDRLRSRVYQAMVEMLAKEAYRLRLRGVEEQLCIDSYRLLVKLNKDATTLSGMARLLALAQGIRAELIELPSKLGLRDRRKVVQALHHDDTVVVEILRDLVSSEGGRQVIMGLKSDPDRSECILNLIEKVLYDTGVYWPIMCGLSISAKPTPHDHACGEALKQKLQRLNVRLSEASLQLPQSVHISGVTVLEHEPIACGAFADIYLGEYRGNRVAIKRLRPSSSQDHEHLGTRAKKLYREISLCKGLDHPNIIPFFGVNRDVLDGNAICIVTQWAQYSGVLNYIDTRKVSSDEICRLLYETMKGLSYLHKQNVVHGDLHGRNILVDHNRRVRLADFGMANFADTTTASGSAARPGLARWPKPETIEPEAYGLSGVRLTRETDMFDFAGVCWEVHDGRSPFARLTPMQAVLEIRNGHRPIREEAKRTIRSVIWHVMEECWRDHPQSRPDARYVLKALDAVAPQVSKTAGERAKYKSFSLPIYSTDRTEKDLSGKCKMGSSQLVYTSAESLPPLPMNHEHASPHHTTARVIEKRSSSQLTSLVNRLTKSRRRQASLPVKQELREHNGHTQLATTSIEHLRLHEAQRRSRG